MLEPDLCYRALVSRDLRFDGRFFVGVQTTGIYCRPICPARTPRRANVRFFRCAAAAEQAGFRACRRCRPEAAPGTPAWAGTSATVARALRMIDAGVLDGGGVALLAERLGVGERHLRRLFLEHLGVGPRAVAATRRSHFARRLLDETGLPMSEVASAAGFASVRRFNAAMRDAFGCPPSELRAARPARVPTEAVEPPPWELRLAFRPPYDWAAWMDFVAQRALATIESVSDGTYRRAFRIAGARGLVEVRPDPSQSAFCATVHLDDPAALLPLAARLRRVLDLEADPEAIGEQLGAASRGLLAPLVRARPGLRLPAAFDPFEAAVRAVLGQQVSVAGARTLASRLVERCGEPAGPQAERLGLTRLFPTPTDVAQADLEGLGLTRARVEALRDLAVAVAEGVVVLDGSRDPEEVIASLLALRGVGPWTAQLIGLRALGDPDAFPVGDLGVSRALARTLGRERSAGEILALAEPWRPWRAYATLHLWQAESAVRLGGGGARCAGG